MGLGAAQLPRLVGKVSAVMALRGRGPSCGGPVLELPVPPQALLYPEAVAVADLELILARVGALGVGAVVDAGPRDSYVAQKGCGFF